MIVSPKKRYILLKKQSSSGGGYSLPSQGGNTGKFLKTDGTSESWSNVDGSISHLIGISSAPSIAVGPGAGSTGGTPTASLDTDATDLAGEITVITVGSTTSGDLCTINFNTSFAKKPKVVLYPANSNASTFFINTAWISSTINGFTIKNGVGAWPVSTNLKWNYHVIQ